MACGSALPLLLLSLSMAARPAGAQDRWIEAEYTITEENPPNSVVGNLSAHPHFNNLPASLRRRQFNFLQSSDQVQQFYVIDEEGVLRTNSVIDRDAVSSCARSMTCDMKLDVGIIGPDRSFQLMKVTVHIEDINDNAPAFLPADTKQLAISETAIPGVSFVLPQAWDPDSGPFGVQSYHLTTTTDRFGLNVSLGADGNVDMRLVLLRRLDREDRSKYTLEVVATDGGNPALTGTLTVEVKVKDANDNIPKFQHPSYEAEVREDTPVGDIILQVLATDLDYGINGEVVYSLASPTPNANPGLLIFGIRNQTGEVILKKVLDYEVQTAYQLLVTAMDKGQDAIPTQASFLIKVIDVNDHPPTIVVNALTATGNAEIPENTDPGGFVAHVSIEDNDSGPSGEVTCVLNPGPFELQKLYRNVYKVIALSRFDTERRSSYVLTLACQDAGVPSLRTEREIWVKILDKNDNTPVFTQDVYSATLRENMTVGALVVQVNASDKDSDENARLAYTIRDDPKRSFRIDHETGIVSTNKVLDYEAMHNARFQVVSVDHGEPPRSSIASVFVNIVDMNDSPPVFYLSSYSFSLEENSQVGTEIGAVLATDKDSEPFNDIVYSFASNDPDSEAFRIDPRLGLIISERVLDREYKPSYTFVVFASNPGYHKMTSSVQVTIILTDINDNAPTIIFPNNTSNTVNIPYGAPEGFIFTKVVAMDVDAGANAKLNYAIARTSERGLFEVDHSSGAFSIKSSDLWEAGNTFDVLITVSDQGSPPKTSSIEMVLHVNKSIVYPGRRDLYPGLDDGALLQSGKAGIGIGPLNHNQTVLISLGIVTLLLVTILIVAIILVRRRKYRGDDDDATSGDGMRNQNNFLKVQPQVKAGSGDYVDADTLPESDSQESGVYSDDTGDHGFKDVKFINNISGGILVKGGPQVTAVSTKVATDADSGCYSVTHEAPWQRAQQQRHPYQQAELTCRPLVDNDRTTAQPKPWSLTQKELEVHQLLQRLPHHPAEQVDSDSTSGCSAEVSTTDSGRGPSEDGDNLMAPVGSIDHRNEDIVRTLSTLAPNATPLGISPDIRTPGRGTRSGMRPPTGTKAGYKVTPPHQHQGPAPTTHLSNNNASRHARTSHDVTHHATGVNSKQNGWHPHGGVKPEAQLAVLDKPSPARSTGNINCNAHHAPYRDADTTRALPLTGKMLIWERFREHAGNCGQLPVSQSRTLASVQETTQDEMSDGASTTSGSYVLDLDDQSRHQSQQAVVIGERDSFV